MSTMDAHREGGVLVESPLVTQGHHPAQTLLAHSRASIGPLTSISTAPARDEVADRVFDGSGRRGSFREARPDHCGNPSFTAWRAPPELAPPGRCPAGPDSSSRLRRCRVGGVALARSTSATTPQPGPCHPRRGHRRRAVGHARTCPGTAAAAPDRRSRPLRQTVTPRSGGIELASSCRRSANEKAKVAVNEASTTFCRRSRYQSRMNRGDSVPVAICTTSTPMVTTSPTSPIIDPDTVASTLLAVDAEYVHSCGSETRDSAQRSMTASIVPAAAPSSGTAHRLCRRCWRTWKRPAQLIISASLRSEAPMASPTGLPDLTPQE